MRGNRGLILVQRYDTPIRSEKDRQNLYIYRGFIDKFSLFWESEKCVMFICFPMLFNDYIL